jgi:hypothetical protein
MRRNSDDQEGDAKQINGGGFPGGSDNGEDNDENEEEEWKYMELEDKKILNKRKKRIDKVED